MKCYHGINKLVRSIMQHLNNIFQAIFLKLTCIHCIFLESRSSKDSILSQEKSWDFFHQQLSVLAFCKIKIIWLSLEVDSSVRVNEMIGKSLSCPLLFFLLNIVVSSVTGTSEESSVLTLIFSLVTHVTNTEFYFI